MVLALTGYVAKPHVADWWLAREACGGALPDRAVEVFVREDTHLASGVDRERAGTGRYVCTLSYERDGRREDGLIMKAVTRRDDRDVNLMKSSTEHATQGESALPAGLPGFVDDMGGVQLLLNCPDLGKDVSGRPVKLLTMTVAPGAYDEQPHMLVRAAVSLANVASDKLGCGAKPLTAPERALPVEPKAVGLDQLAGTPCDWLADAGLPKGRWKAIVAANDAAPTSHCGLIPAAGEQEGEKGEGTLAFTSWYGDWSERLFQKTAERNISSTADGVLVTPQITAKWGRASARCDGEAANYSASSDEESGIKGKALRRLLTTFAEDQVERRGCTDLVLPGRELPAPVRD